MATIFVRFINIGTNSNGTIYTAMECTTAYDQTVIDAPIDPELSTLDMMNTWADMARGAITRITHTAVPNNTRVVFVNPPVAVITSKQAPLGVPIL